MKLAPVCFLSRVFTCFSFFQSPAYSLRLLNHLLPHYYYLLGWPKSAFSFLSKNKRLIFTKNFIEQRIHPFVPLPSVIFSGNFIIPSSQNFLSFWAKNCSRCLLWSSRVLKFFPLREFCKHLNKWKSEDATSGDYSGWIRTSQPSHNSFCLVIKETCGLALSWWKVMHFLLTNSGRFSWSAAYHWSNWEQYLLELIVWFSRRSS